MDEVVADVVVVTAAVVIRDPLVDSVVTTKTQKTDKLAALLSD